MGYLCTEFSVEHQRIPFDTDNGIHREYLNTWNMVHMVERGIRLYQRTPILWLQIRFDKNTDLQYTQH